MAGPSAPGTIPWLRDWDEALAQARATRRPVLIDVGKDACRGCDKLDAVTFPDPAVHAAVIDRFIPLRLHLQNDRAAVRPLGVFWTPTILVADRTGRVHYQSLDFLPPPEFLGILDIGEALSRMRWMEYDLAVARLTDAERRDPDGPLAPEALYWRGIATYFQAGRSASASHAVWEELTARFPTSIWAKRVP